MRMLLAVTLLGSVLSLTLNGQSNRGATPPLVIDSLTGRDSFDRYCASCHGPGGRGDGPVASALKTRPVDLTTLSRRNGGTFPRQRLVAYVDGSNRPLAAHGPTDMPVWGAAFRGLESNEARVRVRIDNLAAYVESLQLPADEAQSPPPPQASGAQLFRAYCEGCHGRNARGNGPMSGQMRNAVPDLTTFAARNGGVFPEERVRQLIAGSGPAAHGDRSMPVWGDVFRRESRGGDSSASSIDSIVVFLRSIQQRPAE